MDMRAKLAPLGAAARLLRVPAKWLRAEAEAGRLPHVKAGNVLLFDVALIQAILLDLAQGEPRCKPSGVARTAGAPDAQGREGAPHD
jgi:hypothetical protein